MSAFEELLPDLSASSKKYFPLSSEVSSLLFVPGPKTPVLRVSMRDALRTCVQFFDAGDAGDVEMIKDFKTFTTPEVFGGFDLTIQAKAFTFQAWVKDDPAIPRGVYDSQTPHVQW